MRETVRMIDISENNGMPGWLPPNWPLAIQTHTFDVCAVRAALADIRQDYAFRQNWEALRASPRIQGAYQFCQPGYSPTLQANAQAQARFLWAQIQDLGGAHPDDLPPMLDVEIAEGLSPVDLQQWTTTALTELAQLSGRKTLLYTYSAFLAEYLSPLIGAWPLIIAQYSPEPPAVTQGRVGWQYTSQSTVPGFRTPIDRDHWWTGGLPSQPGWEDLLYPTPPKKECC